MLCMKIGLFHNLSKDYNYNYITHSGSYHLTECKIKYQVFVLSYCLGVVTVLGDLCLLKDSLSLICVS